MILRDQGLIEEADLRRNEARNARDSLAIFASGSPPPFNLDDEDEEVACFDYLTPLASGRMFGAMNISRNAPFNPAAKI